MYLFDYNSYVDSKYGHQIPECWHFWNFCDSFNLSSAHACSVVSVKNLWNSHVQYVLIMNGQHTGVDCTPFRVFGKVWMFRLECLNITWLLTLFLWLFAPGPILHFHTLVSGCRQMFTFNHWLWQSPSIDFWLLIMNVYHQVLNVRTVVVLSTISRTFNHPLLGIGLYFDVWVCMIILKAMLFW